MQYPGFIGPSYLAQSPTADRERLVNMYVAKTTSPAAKSPFYLCPTPGATLRMTMPQSPIRGMFAKQGRAFAVAGGKIKEFDQNLNVTDIGDVAIDGNPITATTNGDGGDQILWTSGNRAYLQDRTSNLLTEVVNGAMQCGMLNTFFYVFDVNTGTLKASASYDGTSWDGAAIAQRGTAPDPWQSMVMANQKVYMIGSETSDVYYDASGVPFPLAPIVGALIPYGTCARFSAINFNGMVAWLAQTEHGARQVVAATGYSSAEVLSTRELEAQLATYARVDDAESLVYQVLGISFLVINFPSAKATWAYNEEGGWSELGTWQPNANEFDAWHARSHVFAFDRHWVGDRTTGNISTLETGTSIDVGGGPLLRMRQAPSISRALKQLIIDNFSLFVQSGVGTIAGQGEDPQVMMRKTRNGGKTWGNERWRALGKMGKDAKRVRWSCLGSGRDVGVRVTMSDPAPLYIVDAYVNERAD